MRGCYLARYGLPGGTLNLYRTWNQLKSKVYTRLPFLNELYGRLRARRLASDPPLPPLAPLGCPLNEARVALLTSAGVHQSDQAGFDMHHDLGDASFRVIAGQSATHDLTITHDYYDHSAADRDLNCVFPLDRLRELVASEVIGSVAPRHVGFMGHILGQRRVELVEESARAIADLFVTDDVHLVVGSPG